MTVVSEHVCLSKLNQLQLPDKLIDLLIHQQTTLTLEQKVEQLSAVTSNISQWIETIHLALFTLEQNIKQQQQQQQQQQQDSSSDDTHALEDAVQRMTPIIDSLADLSEMLDDHYSDQENTTQIITAKATITKIQSEWSGLQHFLSSVKQSYAAMDEEKQLRQLMDQVIVQIEDLSTLVFQYQEQRSNGQTKAITIASASPSIPASTSNSSSSSRSSRSSASANAAAEISSSAISPPSCSSSSSHPPEMSDKKKPTNPDDILVDIDNRVGPVFAHVDKIYARMVSDTPPLDSTGILLRRHRTIQERWECLRVEIDELKADLKEDRWLAVFKQVADQVEAMMGGLDKTVEQCQTMVQQVRDWQGFQHLASSSSSSTVTPQQPYPVPPKGILRSSKSHHSSASISSTSSSGSASAAAAVASATIPPVDYHKLRSVEKNFEAKYKYCTPLITKMLSMLGDGIAARVAENSATVARHRHMVQRWHQLKIAMDDLRIRDLPDIERLVMFERPISPAWSKVSDRSDKSANSHQLYKSPEPGYDMYDYRSSSSASNHHHSHHNNSLSFNGGGRARSPLSLQHGSSNNGFMSPTTQLYNMHEELRRGRSVTPSSGTGSRDHISLWRSAHGGSPVNGRTMTRTTSPLSSFHDILKPSTSDTPSVGSSPSRSGVKYSNASFWQEDITTKQRAPVEVPHQNRSRQEELPYEGRRSVTPVRRAGTPSMIPRPKTPSQEQTNASQIPRPRSSMMRSPPSHHRLTPSPSTFLTTSTSPPPSPPHVSKRTLNRKYSSPILNQQSRMLQQHHDDHRMFTQTPPPPSSRRYYDLMEEEEEDEDEDADSILYSHSFRRQQLQQQQQQQQQQHRQLEGINDRHIYIPDPKDPLDVEVAKIINGNPIRILCEKGSQSGRYYFGHELNPTPGGGRKVYTCKLMTYTDRDRRTNGFNHGKSGSTRKKVLTRVGGGWIDLEIFLLEHHNLMLSH